MMKMNTKKLALLCISIVALATPAMASFTIATFENPSPGSEQPMFWVDWQAETIDGGWDQGNLVLNLPYIGSTFNAWFEMDTVDIVSQQNVFGQTIGQTGAGEVFFYEEGTNDLLLAISFAGAIIQEGSFWSHDAVFSTPLIAETLFDEQFSFGFANKVSKTGGFTATAVFDSSAIPEPATVMLLGIGAVLSTCVKKRFH